MSTINNFGLMMKSTFSKNLPEGYPPNTTSKLSELIREPINATLYLFYSDTEMRTGVLVGGGC